MNTVLLGVAIAFLVALLVLGILAMFFYKVVLPSLQRRRQRTIFGHVEPSKEGERQKNTKKETVVVKTTTDKKSGNPWKTFFRRTGKILLVICAIWLIFMGGCNSIMVYSGHYLEGRIAGVQPNAGRVQPNSAAVHPNFNSWKIVPIPYDGKSNYFDRDPPSIQITLVEGSYGRDYILPYVWEDWEPILSTNPGDYVSTWCNGELNSRPPVDYTVPRLGKAFRYCFGPEDRSPHFRLQGHGTLTIIPIRKRHFLRGLSQSFSSNSPQ